MFATAAFSNWISQANFYFCSVSEKRCSGDWITNVSKIRSHDPIIPLGGDLFRSLRYATISHYEVTFIDQTLQTKNVEAIFICLAKQLETAKPLNEDKFRRAQKFHKI